MSPLNDKNAQSGTSDMDDKIGRDNLADPSEIKPAKSGHLAAVLFLAAIFLLVFLAVEFAGFLVSDLETRVKTKIKETVEELKGNLEFTFPNFDSTGKQNKSSPKGPGKKKILTTYPKRGFENELVTLRMQASGNSSGSFKTVTESGNSMLSLKVKSLKAVTGKQGYGVTGMLDLKAELRTKSLNGVFFSVRGNSLEKFGVSLWGYRNEKWFRYSVHGLEAGTGWMAVKIPLDDFSWETYNPDTGRYAKTESPQKPDSLYWVGWHIDSRNYPEGTSGELQIDNLGFY